MNESVSRSLSLANVYERVRNIYKVGGPVSSALSMTATIFFFIYCIFQVIGVIGDAGSRGTNGLILFLTFMCDVPFLYLVISTTRKVKATWAEVKKVCNEKSAGDSGYRYVLDDEIFGGCKSTSRNRIFIMIYEDNPDVESPAVVFPLPLMQSSVSTSSNVSSSSSSENFNDDSLAPASAPAETTTGFGKNTSGGDAASIFDQLKI